MSTAARRTTTGTPLDGLEPWQDLGRADLDRIWRSGRQVSIPEGWSFIIEREPADKAYVLLAGTARVSHGRHQVAQLGPGALIGEMALAAHRLRTATVTALEPLRALHFTRAEFESLCTEVPTLGRLAQDTTGQRLQNLDDARKVDTVVVDVDGTLMDSNYHLTLAWFRAFRRLGYSIPSWRIHRHMGMGGDRLVTEVAGEEIEAEHGDEIRELWRAEYDKLVYEVPALDGATELLDALRERGLNVVLASSGAPQHTEHALHETGADRRSDAVTTGEDAERSKPAPDLIDVALQRVQDHRAIVLGDSVWDVRAADQRGLPTIGLLTGGFGRAELLDAGAADVFEDHRDLLANLDAVLSP